jgi:hypothetical protein
MPKNTKRDLVEWVILGSTDDVNLLVRSMKSNAERSLDASREVGLEEN